MVDAALDPFLWALKSRVITTMDEVEAARQVTAHYQQVGGPLIVNAALSQTVVETRLRTLLEVWELAAGSVWEPVCVWAECRHFGDQSFGFGECPKEHTAPKMAHRVEGDVA